MNGFSEDGYIIDQDCFSEYRYRTVASSRNGCGWIAAYNFRRALGQKTDFDSVRAEMDEMFVLRVPGPTTMNVMLRYLSRHVPGYDIARGREAASEVASRSKACILRYLEEKVPHFVACVRTEEGLFRFFNVADGLEDYTTSMDDFLSTHCRRGAVTLIGGS